MADMEDKYDHYCADARESIQTDREGMKDWRICPKIVFVIAEMLIGSAIFARQI